MRRTPSQRDIDAYKHGKIISDREAAGESFLGMAQEMKLSVHTVRQKVYRWRRAVLMDWLRDTPKPNYMFEIYKALVRQGVIVDEHGPVDALPSLDVMEGMEKLRAEVKWLRSEVEKLKERMDTRDHEEERAIWAERESRERE